MTIEYCKDDSPPQINPYIWYNSNQILQRQFVVLNPKINIKQKIVKNKKIVMINNMWGTCPIRSQVLLYRL